MRPRICSILRSACAKVSATTGSRSRRVRVMFTYCEPWPVKRKATFGAGPWPRKIPCPRSGRQAAGLPPASAFSAFSIFSASSCALPKSIATRSGARRSASRGGAGAGARPCRASSWAAWSFFASSVSSAAPTRSAPRSGGFGAAEGAAAGAAGTETCTGRLPFVRAPGTCSSRTTWKFVPPKPKAERPARRTPQAGFSHSRSSVLT